MQLPRQKLFALSGGLLLCAALTSVACGTSITDIDIPEEDGRVDAGTGGGEDAGTDGGEDAGAGCSETCMPGAELYWTDPVLLWFGPADAVPACPTNAPKVMYEGNRDLVATNACPLCLCDDPACVLPSGLVASTVATCPNDGPGATLTPFDAPPNWDGSCTSPTTIPSNLLASVSIQPPTVSACKPKMAPVPKAGNAPTWQTAAIACDAELVGQCDDLKQKCVPTLPPNEGFQYCVGYLGPKSDPVCPPDYPDKQVFYKGFTDMRDCTPCECIPPTNSECSASVGIYKDAACGGGPFALATVDLSTTNACMSGIIPGTELQGMTAQWATNNPGVCTPSGGEPFGEVTPTDAAVFCCEAPAM